MAVKEISGVYERQKKKPERKFNFVRKTVTIKLYVTKQGITTRDENELKAAMKTTRVAKQNRLKTKKNKQRSRVTSSAAAFCGLAGGSSGFCGGGGGGWFKTAAA